MLFKKVILIKICKKMFKFLIIQSHVFNTTYSQKSSKGFFSKFATLRK